MKKIYRARTTNLNRNHWVTNVWRPSFKEAELDARALKRPDEKIKVVEVDYKDYIKKHQRIPKL